MAYGLGTRLRVWRSLDPQRRLAPIDTALARPPAELLDGYPPAR